MKLMGILVTLITAFYFSSTANATNAIGVVIGDPTGLSGRFSLDSRHSVEGAIALSSSEYDGTHIHATYLWDRARTFATSGAGPIELYYGLGIRIINISHGRYDGDTAIGPRAPLGLLY
ncbi:MAG: hypothetical protein ACXVCP_10935, partial [Bdellovibrio sp.]